MRNVVDLKKELVYVVNAKNEVCAVRGLDGRLKPLSRYTLNAQKRTKRK